RWRRALAGTIFPDGERTSGPSTEPCSDPAAENADQQRQRIESAHSGYGSLAGEPSFEVGGKLSGDAGREVTHQAGPAELRERTFERVADLQFDAGRTDGRSVRHAVEDHALRGGAPTRIGACTDDT